MKKGIEGSQIAPYEVVVRCLRSVPNYDTAHILLLLLGGAEVGISAFNRLRVAAFTVPCLTYALFLVSFSFYTPVIVM